MTEKHSPLQLQAQPYIEGEDAVAIIALRDGGDNPSDGLVALATLLPTELDAADPSRARDVAAMIVRSVNGLPEAIAALETTKTMLADQVIGAAIVDIATMQTLNGVIAAALTKLKG